MERTVPAFDAGWIPERPQQKPLRDAWKSASFFIICGVQVQRLFPIGPKHSFALWNARLWSPLNLLIAILAGLSTR